MEVVVPADSEPGSLLLVQMPGRAAENLESCEEAELESPLILPPGEDGDEDDDLPHGCKFGTGQAVEVYRTDGSWSLAQVEDTDELTMTYTVMLPDGRRK